MNILSEQLLRDHAACKDGMDFVIRNKLIGYPLNKLHHISGDYMGYVRWLSIIGGIVKNRKLVEYMEGPTVVELTIATNGVITTNEYDLRGNRTYYRLGNYECWSVYDSRDNKICHKSGIGGYELSMGYDDRGNMIATDNGEGDATVSGYDDRDRLIHHIRNDGYEEWYEYNDTDDIIEFRNTVGGGSVREYDDRRNNIRCVSEDGYEIVKVFDNKNRVIESRDSNNRVETTRYDEVGNEIGHTLGGVVLVDLDIKFYTNGQLKSIGDKNGMCHIPLMGDL